MRSKLDIRASNGIVSADDGTVASCGQTGPATAEPQAIHDAAFAN